MTLVGRRMPSLVRRQGEEPDMALERTATPSVPSDKISRLCFRVSAEPAKLDPFWVGTAMNPMAIATTGFMVLAPESMAGLFPDNRLFLEWDGDFASVPEGPGLALELRNTPEPCFEAERVRRIISWAPRRLIEEAGRTRCPEILIWGDMRAMREFPPRLADVAVIQAAGMIPEDLELAPQPVIYMNEPMKCMPPWVGTPVMVGPDFFWREPWMEDPRLQVRA